MSPVKIFRKGQLFKKQGLMGRIIRKNTCDQTENVWLYHDKSKSRQTLYLRCKEPWSSLFCSHRTWKHGSKRMDPELLCAAKFPFIYDHSYYRCLQAQNILMSKSHCCCSPASIMSSITMLDQLTFFQRECFSVSQACLQFV